MILKTLDIAIILSFMSLTLVVSLYVRLRGSRNTAGYFLGKREMLLWLLGLSMVMP